MSINQRRIIKNFIFTLIVGYFVLNLTVGLYMAVIDDIWGKCNTNLNKKIETVFWGYATGCWLLEERSE